jgi:hypothetical protein
MELFTCDWSVSIPLAITTLDPSIHGLDYYSNSREELLGHQSALLKKDAERSGLFGTFQNNFGKKKNSLVIRYSCLF